MSNKNTVIALVNTLILLLIGMLFANMLMEGGIAMDERWSYEQYSQSIGAIQLVLPLLALGGFILNISLLIASLS